MKINEKAPKTLIGIEAAYLEPVHLYIVQRDESFYVHYCLCDMGVTHVNDLRAIRPINPCQALLHTSSIPSLKWFTLWLHEVMRETWLSILHVCKKSSSVETTGGVECCLCAWWRELIKTQVSINCTMYSTLSFSQRRPSLSHTYWPYS